MSLSEGVAADQEVYLRLERDLKAIHSLEPKVSGVHYTPRHDGRTLLIKFDQAAVGSALECLNAQYGGKFADLRAHGIKEIVFNRISNLDRLAQIYARIPGVQYAEPNRLTSTGPTKTLCVSTRDEIWHYVLQVTDGEDRALYHFVTNPFSQPQLLGRQSIRESRDMSESAPSWIREFWNEKSC